MIEITDGMNEISSNELEMCFPIFNKRITNTMEKEGTYVISSNKLIRSIEVNSTCFFIYSLCNGNNSILNIINLVVEKLFGKYDTVKNDVLYILFSTWRLNILQWKKGKHPFSNLFKYETKEHGNIVTYLSLTNTDIYKEISFLDKKFQINPYVDCDKEYKKVNLNVRIATNTENFFELKCNNKVMLSLSIRPYTVFKPVPTILGFDIYYFNINENLMDNINSYLPKFLSWVCNWYMDYIQIYSFGDTTNMYFYIEENQPESVKNRLKNLGFNQKGVLEREILNRNIIIYEYNVKMEV